MGEREGEHLLGRLRREGEVQLIRDATAADVEALVLVKQPVHAAAGQRGLLGHIGARREDAAPVDRRAVGVVLPRICVIPTRPTVRQCADMPVSSG